MKNKLAVNLSVIQEGDFADKFSVINQSGFINVSPHLSFLLSRYNFRIFVRPVIVPFDNV